MPNDSTGVLSWSKSTLGLVLETCTSPRVAGEEEAETTDLACWLDFLSLRTNFLPLVENRSKAASRRLWLALLSIKLVEQDHSIPLSNPISVEQVLPVKPRFLKSASCFCVILDIWYQEEMVDESKVQVIGF